MTLSRHSFSLIDIQFDKNSYRPTIFIIDDDEQIADTNKILLESVHSRVKVFAKAQDFLDEYQPNTEGCLIADVRMPDITGLELQETLKENSFRMPIVFLTAYADVQTAVRAMKQGAFDFLTKPVNSQILLETVNKALSYDLRRREIEFKDAEIALRIKRLTPREKQILSELVRGRLNDAIAEKLGISQKTVELHRSNVMKKMNIKTAAQLVRLILVSGLADEYR